MDKTIKRCEWSTSNELLKNYHDNEWGKECHNEKMLFEMLILEGKQAGLSWDIVLKRREGLREAFDGFDPKIISKYDEKKISELLENPKIIRNKLKVNAAITNSKAYLELVKNHGSLDKFIWSYVDNKPIINHWKIIADVPVKSELSDNLSKDLKKMGFKFVGSVIIYSFMQAVGMINDHLEDCSFKN